MAAQRGGRADPFYLVRDEIQETLDRLGEAFSSWERVPHGDKAKPKAGADLLSRIGEGFS